MRGPQGQVLNKCRGRLIEKIRYAKLKENNNWTKDKTEPQHIPKFFLSCQKRPFGFDHIGEKIIVVQFFLDFLWIFKIWKIRVTVVHGRVTRRVGRVGLWRQPGKPFRLERWWESEQTADQRSQRDYSEEKILQCLIGALLRIAVMWWICLNLYLYTTYLPLAIKQPFHENTTAQVGINSSNSFSGICPDGYC